ncbi:MAG: hypothetical protein ACLT2T_14155 [Bilophila wadsworthia]
MELEVVKAPGDFFGFHFVVNGAVGTGNRGHAEAAGKAFGIDFIAGSRMTRHEGPMKISLRSLVVTRRAKRKSSAKKP